jgi:N-acyl-D-aspartate/D-glutamate deacylase
LRDGTTAVHDLVIRGGTVVDGTGAPARIADVAVADGTIVAVGRVTENARRVIDADGLLVTPGFVDIHTHFDGQATWDPHLTPSAWHGVTTAIMGNCGVGFAPAEPARHEFLIQLMEGVEDIPGSALADGIKWDWESFPEYLDALDRMPRAIDIGTHVPHAALRAYVMRDRAYGLATETDIGAMRGLVGESLAAGALGFSTGRTAGHRDVHGEPVPGTFAAEDEIVAIVDVMAELGQGVLQLVPAGVGGEISLDAPGAMETELEWMLRCGEVSQRPITFLVMQRGDAPDLWREWFARVHDANARGAQLRPQVANRCFGVLMGHQSRLNPFAYRPSFRALADLPFPARMARLRDPETRTRILNERSDANGVMALDRLGLRSFDNLFPLGASLDYEPAPDASIGAIARRTGRDVWEVAYDTMLEADGREFLLLPLLNYGNGSYDGLYDMMQDPYTVQGLGDGGAHCGVICDATMTTYMLSHWARDRDRGPRLPIERAVRRLTRDPAELYGLGDRGAIAPGMRADLNVVDFDGLALRYPEQVHDLPAGAGRLIQRADGYVATIVRGEPVVEHDELTDARPGRVIRGPQSASNAR